MTGSAFHQEVGIPDGLFVVTGMAGEAIGRFLAVMPETGGLQVAHGARHRRMRLARGRPGVHEAQDPPGSLLRRILPFAMAMKAEFPDPAYSLRAFRVGLFVAGDTGPILCRWLREGFPGLMAACTKILPRRPGLSSQEGLAMGTVTADAVGIPLRIHRTPLSVAARRQVLRDLVVAGQALLGLEKIPPRLAHIPGLGVVLQGDALVAFAAGKRAVGRHVKEPALDPPAGRGGAGQNQGQECQPCQPKGPVQGSLPTT